MKTTRTLFTRLTFVTLQTFSLFAQVNQEWATRYNGPGNAEDIARSIAVDASGNVYITGQSLGSGTNLDYATIKYNSSGVLQWIQRYNGPGSSLDAAVSLAVDASGNVYVTGFSLGSGTSLDYATIKYNSSGVQQWIQRYNGPGNGADYGYSLTLDASGNVYVTGYSTGGQTLMDYATIKYNSSGIQQWEARYNGPTDAADYAYSLALDASGNVYVTGQSTGSGTLFDYATVKYNSSGVQQWVQRYNGPGNLNDVARSIAVDNAGNVFVTGQSDSTFFLTDYATIKYNSSGVQQWLQRYNGPGNGNDFAYSLALDGSANVYVTGQSTGSGTVFDYATIKYNSSGVQQWVQRYHGPGNAADYANSLTLDVSANVYVTGQSIGGGTDFDYATIKYNSSGVQQWVQRYNGPGNFRDWAFAIVADTSGNVYVTGGSGGSGTGADYATIKYSQQVGIQPISNQIPREFMLYQNYPNPFNPTTNIKFAISNLGHVKLVIYDILGREIATLANEHLKPGTYELEWNASNYPSGVYYYTLNAGDYNETKKMVLIK